MDIEELNVVDFPEQSIRALEIVSEHEIAMASDQGRLNITKDGGKSWLNLAIPSDEKTYPVRSIAFHKGKYYVLSIDNPAILWSVDKDFSFSKLFQNEFQGVFFDAMDIDKHGDLIAWGDPIAGTMNFLELGIGENKPVEYIRNDSHNMPASVVGETAFAASDSNIMWVDGYVYAISGGMASRFYKKSQNIDGPWMTAKLPIIQGKSTTGAYAMDFYNADIGIVVGGDFTNKQVKSENIAFTEDGGKTWTSIEERNSPGYKSCVQYIPNKQGKELISISVNGFHYSNDGGKTWSVLGEFEGYYTFRFVDENHFWASGVEKAGYFRLNRN
jgi:photosystem II stability/assembly factor-like uncharacterized protein